VGERAAVDAAGLGTRLVTSRALQFLSLKNNSIGNMHSEMRKFSRGLSSNKTLTHLDLSDNQLGPDGVRSVCVALRTCISLLRLDLSYNTPGREPALAELMRVHQTLENVGIIEREPTTRMERTFHLDARAKEAIGRALLSASTRNIRFMQCDVFALNENTTTLAWGARSASDAPCPPWRITTPAGWWSSSLTTTPFLSPLWIGSIGRRSSMSASMYST
jgi:hypothetical protein